MKRIGLIVLLLSNAMFGLSFSEMTKQQAPDDQSKIRWERPANLPPRKAAASNTSSAVSAKPGNETTATHLEKTKRHAKSTHQGRRLATSIPGIISR